MASNEKKPLFTKGLLLFLIVIFAATGAIAYYINKPADKPDPHKGNPNVKLLPKERWKPKKLSFTQRYISRFVFPVMKKHQKTILDCYFGYKGKAKLQKHSGVVSVNFTVNQDGTVAKTELHRSEVKIKEIEACILQKTKTFVFQKHNEPKPVQFQFPFMLK